MVGESSLGRLPIVGQQFSNSFDWMFREARENVLEPGEGFDPDPLARGRKAPQDCIRLAALVAAEKGPVVAPYRHAADGAFGGIVIDAESAVLAVAVQCCPVLQGVAHRTPLRTLRQHLRLNLQQVVMQLI